MTPSPHQQTASATTQSWSLEFHAASEAPTRPEKHGFPQAVLYNQCDGFHLAFARFYPDGDFDGFYDWCGTSPYEPDKHFCAWALLPDSLALLDTFARKGPYGEPFSVTASATMGGEE